VRDFGPIFVRKIADGVVNKNAGLVATNWIFNTWGGKYPPWDKDNAIPSQIATELKLEKVTPGIVLEGGSIDVNGEGDLLTTEQCLLNKNRNPELNPAEIEEYLRKFLGAENIIWLKEGIQGDDTDGHIDDIARFTDANTIACAFEENEKDENYEILKEVYEDLLKAKNHAGKPFRVVRIPMPDPVLYDHQLLPASYMNFYIANKAVLLPIFGDQKTTANKKDAEAEKILQQLFPTRKIIPINCRDLIWGLGAIHCSTQQQPS
jgi:agmatine deiminase